MRIKNEEIVWEIWVYRKLFFLIFFISFPMDSFAEGLSINGIWKDQNKVVFGKDELKEWGVREIKFATPKYILTMSKYETPQSEKPYVVFVREGHFTIKKSITKGLYDLNLTLDKHTFTYFTENKQIAVLNINECSKIGEPLDLIENACGKLSMFKNSRAFYTILDFLNSKTILLGSTVAVPKTEDLRAYLLDVRPLTKQAERWH